MKESTLECTDFLGGKTSVPITWVHTLVLGSGAAGLNTACQLRAAGIQDLLVITEGLQMGTSINTGSDKQTYYKLSMCGSDSDSPAAMAETYFSGGGMHGDLALVEASLSARAFINLVNLGVPFPRDGYGQFIGYKTDHDPRQRATSIGPYTSREMCRALIRQAVRLEIPIYESRNAVQLLTLGEGKAARAAGVIAMRDDQTLEVFAAENVVFAVGGPGGIYKTSVYPDVHTGAIGLAFEAGALASNLPESQYGLASTKFRWNVSGTYMQVIPRFISTEPDGVSHPREFMRDYFDNTGKMNSQVFLKGYQWPFDSRKVNGGSSIVDILVYIETVLNGRRVFLDFRENPQAFSFDDLSQEAREYLEKSGARLPTPIDRLRHMNPGAIELYHDHGIDITTEPLEIAVCAQHNNGGLAANLWWESENIRHLFPVGEVNGSHGIYRPGGSALNSGQVGAFRAAEFIANRYAEWTVDKSQLEQTAAQHITNLLSWIDRCSNAASDWRTVREEFQSRMSRAGAHIRSKQALEQAVGDAWQQYRSLLEQGCRCDDCSELAEALRNRQLCLAHAVYLDAVAFAIAQGIGSRGSGIALDPDGQPIHEQLDETWRVIPENTAFRDKTLRTYPNPDGRTRHEWIPCRPMPHSDTWFETAWARFRSGEIYQTETCSGKQEG